MRMREEEEMDGGAVGEEEERSKRSEGVEEEDRRIREMTKALDERGWRRREREERNQRGEEWRRRTVF